MMIPVDMRGVGEDFEDVEQMTEKLGPKGTAEAFVKAREYFEANKDEEQEEDRPKEMKASEWRQILQEEDDLEGEEEEDDLEDEEEELEEDGEAAEPAAKKAKTG